MYSLVCSILTGRSEEADIERMIFFISFNRQTTIPNHLDHLGSLFSFVSLQKAMRIVQSQNLWLK